MELTYTDLMDKIQEACVHIEIQKGWTVKDLAISMPDWCLDLLLCKLKENLGIEIKKGNNTIYGLPVVPNYEDKVVVFDKDYKKSGIEPIKIIINPAHISSSHKQPS